MTTAPPQPTGLPGYTIAPDYAGDPHVWRDDNGRRVPVLSRYHCADARLWEFIVAGIGGGEVKPRMLDLFAGAGGCSVGYARAGFDVEGVDLEPHPDYPYRAHVADALSVLTDDAFLARFDAIHASPPCQGFTTMSNRWRGNGGKADGHPDLISWVRLGLEAWGGPYVIENVPGARRELRNPITLRGGMFGLGVDRPRLFESNVALTVPPHTRVANPVGVYGKLDGRRLWARADGTEQRAARTLEEGQRAMGISWMQWHDLTEAVPPAYTEHIGGQLVEHLGRVAA